MKLSVLVVALVGLNISLHSNAIEYENIKSVEKGEVTMSTSRVSIKSSGWMNYLKKIVRIEGVKTEKGDVVFERGMISPYKKEIALSSPGKYRIKLLCERPIKLSKRHPELDLEVSPQCDYVIDCEDISGQIKPVVTTTCKG